MAIAVLLAAGLRGGAQGAGPLFTDVTDAVGIDFTHVNGATGRLLLPEVIGAGGALFDYDNDGDVDVFAVQGGALTASGAGAPAAPPSRLFRNDLNLGRGLRFTDVTAQSGLGVAGYGMGAAAGDVDNDGWVDLYVTYLGSNRLFRNRGDGTFADVTASSRTGDPRWSVSATFVDYDRDGWLDLYVVNYVRFVPELARACYTAGSARDYCNPAVYEPVADSLFHNEHDGTFADVSARAGLARAPGRGLGVIGADVDGDGWTDLFVANDGDPNRLWLNERGTGRFRDEALLAGVALNRMGQAQGSMGVDAGDADGDGDEDLFVTNLDNEGNTFYASLGRGLFEERTAEVGLATRGYTGFGTRFLDYDNDGWLDLLVVNGAVRHLSRQAQAGDPYPLKQRNQIFHGERGRRFTEITGPAAAAFAPLRVSRGLGIGDLDNDGDADAVVFGNNGPLRVLRNDATAGRHWLGLRVLDGRARRDALHARVELVRRGGAAWRRVQADGSYATAGDPRVVFGLGTDAEPQTVRVHRPGAAPETFSGLRPDRYWELVPGEAPRPAR